MVSVDSDGSSKLLLEQLLASPLSENTHTTFDLGLKGGPLEQEHALWQFHAHWGDDGTKGSEHTLDGKRFAAEVTLSFCEVLVHSFIQGWLILIRFASAPFGSLEQREVWNSRGSCSPA